MTELYYSFVMFNKSTYIGLMSSKTTIDDQDNLQLYHKGGVRQGETNRRGSFGGRGKEELL